MSKCFGLFSEVTEFARPMSRRQATNRRELLLPSLIPARHQTGIVFDPWVPPDPAAAINGETGESSEAWTRHSTHYRTRQASQTIDVAIADLIAGNHLLARLVFQRIRPRTHSGMIGGQSCSPDDLQRARAAITPPDIATPLIECAEVPFSAPIPPAIATLFTELARRRFRIRAKEEKR